MLDKLTNQANLPDGAFRDTGEERTVFMTFDVVMKKEDAVEDMVKELDTVSGVSELKVIASKTDIDY